LTRLRRTTYTASAEAHLKRQLIGSILATVVLVVVVVGLGTVFRADPPVSPAAPSPEPVAARKAEACQSACDRLTICGHTLAGEGCLERCVGSWDLTAVSCVQREACDQMDQCLSTDAEAECEAACDKAGECGLVIAGDDCLAVCRDQWDESLRECLLDVVCAEVEAVCLPAIQPGECTVFCDRLADCDLLPEGDDADCFETCLMLDDAVLRECVARIDCALIEPVCLADDFDPLCLDACRRLEDCDALGDIVPDFCPAVCLESWGDETLSCIFDTGCDALAPVCLGAPEPVCEDVCTRLVACGLENELDDCAITCSTGLDDAARQCILDVACEQIDTVCFGTRPDVCAVVCDKLVACGLDSDFDVCYEACDAGADLELMRCILGNSCETIADNCGQ
jgi:hypothetical protein